MGQRVRARKDGKSKGTAVKNYGVKNASTGNSVKKKYKKKKKGK